MSYADDDMCPNCVTPWKCNGPHIDYSDAVFLHELLDQQRRTWDERHGDQS